MSGGSYSYLCFSDSSDLFGKFEALRRMADRLRPYSRQAAWQTEALIAVGDDLERRIAALSALWRVVEWVDSNDKAEGDIAPAVAEYEAANAGDDAVTRVLTAFADAWDAVHEERRAAELPTYSRAFGDWSSEAVAKSGPPEPGSHGYVDTLIAAARKLIDSGVLLGAQQSELGRLQGWDRDALGVVCRNGHHTRFVDAVGDPAAADWKCPHCVAHGLTDSPGFGAHLVEQLTKARDAVVRWRDAHEEAKRVLLDVVGGDWIAPPGVITLAKAAAHLIRMNRSTEDRVGAGLATLSKEVRRPDGSYDVDSMLTLALLDRSATSEGVKAMADKDVRVREILHAALGQEFKLLSDAEELATRVASMTGARIPVQRPTMACTRCGQDTGNNNQGHHWAWCKVTKTTREFHFCCPGDCSLEADTVETNEGDGS